MIQSNPLELFYEELDGSCWTARDHTLINSKLADISTSLKDNPTLFLLSEMEREAFALNKLSSKDKSGKIIGLSSRTTWVAGRTESGDDILTYWPDINNFSKSHFDYIESRYKTIKNLYAKTEFGLILYFQKPSAYSKRVDFKKQLCQELFLLSKSYYQDLLSETEKLKKYTHFRYSTIAFEHALEIAKNIKYKEIKEICNWAHEIHQSDSYDDMTSSILIELTRLFTSHFREFSKSTDLKSVLEKNNRFCADINNDNSSRSGLIDASMQLEQKGQSKHFNWKKEKAALCEILAKEEESNNSNFAALSYIEDALRLYQEIKDQDGIARLQQRYTEIRGKGSLATIKESLKDEKTFALQKKLEEIVENAPAEELLRIVGDGLLMPKSELIHQQVEKRIKNPRISDFGQNSIIDKLGNTIATYTTNEEKKNYFFWNIYGFQHQINSQWLIFFLMKAFEVEKFNKEKSIMLLEKSWYNAPIGRLYQGTLVNVVPYDLLKPVVELFFTEYEYWMKNKITPPNIIPLMDSLTLKIEALLRYFCERIGIPTFRTKQDDVVMEKNIDEILASLEDTPTQVTHFDEEDRIYIKYVLSEKVGWNLRNKVAHGLLDSNEYTMETCTIVFGLILRLANYSFS